MTPALLLRQCAAWTLGLACLASHATPDADEWLQKVRSRPDGKDWMSPTELVLRDKTGQERIRKLVFLKRQQGSDEAYVMRFESPSEVKAVGFVSVAKDEAAGLDDDLWMYLPASRQVRRLATSDKRGSFMGSQFSYYDIEKVRVKDFQQQVVGEEQIDGRDTVKLERLPASEAVTERCGYSKVITWVDKATLVIFQQELFDERGVLAKRMRVKRLEQIDGYWTPVEIEMENLADNRLSLLRFLDTRYDRGLDVQLFLPANLSNGGLYDRLSEAR